LRTVKLFLYGLVGLLIVLFVIQNYSTLTYSVSIRLNLGFLTLESIPLPFFVIAPILFFSGVLLATGIGLVERRRLSKELKQAKTDLQESKQRERPLGELSSFPVPPSETGGSPPNHETPSQS
jgi:lipopolysaccharide assembly protein A